MILIFAAGRLPARLRIMMRNVCTYIAGTDARVRPLIRLADWSCMFVTTRGPDVQLDAGLIGKTRL
jgi:hypothetical protein